MQFDVIDESVRMVWYRGSTSKACYDELHRARVENVSTACFAYEQSPGDPWFNKGGALWWAEAPSVPLEGEVEVGHESEEGQSEGYSEEEDVAEGNHGSGAALDDAAMEYDDYGAGSGRELHGYDDYNGGSGGYNGSRGPLDDGPYDDEGYDYGGSRRYHYGNYCLRRSVAVEPEKQSGNVYVAGKSNKTTAAADACMKPSNITDPSPSCTKRAVPTIYAEEEPGVVWVLPFQNLSHLENYEQHPLSNVSLLFILFHRALYIILHSSK